jgi:hypothetical protein
MLGLLKGDGAWQGKSSWVEAEQEEEVRPVVAGGTWTGGGSCRGAWGCHVASPRCHLPIDCLTRRICRNR